MPGDVIRVVLADDHAVVRAGLRAVLSPAKDITVIGEATNGKEAVALAERFNPDVVIMDLSMPDVDGMAATKAILAKQSGTRILVLTMHAEEEYLLPLLEAGASGYLVKSAADLELVTAVRAVAHGPPRRGGRRVGRIEGVARHFGHLALYLTVHVRPATRSRWATSGSRPGTCCPRRPSRRDCIDLRRATDGDSGGDGAFAPARRRQG